LEGDNPNEKCYVVLSGKVGVYRNQVHSTIQIKDKNLKAFEPEAGRYPSFNDPIYQGEDRRVLRKLLYYGDLLAKLGYGALFGETGILNDNLRNATVVAMEPTELMVFHKDALDMIKRFYSQDFNQRKTFLMKMIPEIAMISNQLRITQLIEFFKPIKVKHQSFLFREGDLDNKVYLMQEGELVLLKTVELAEVKGSREIVYKRKETQITTIQGVGIIGEESLEGVPYAYSAVVKSSELIGFVFEKTSNFSDFQSFPLFPILLKRFYLKE